MDEIVNRVANSKLLSLDIEEYIDRQGQTLFDLARALGGGFILREKDFRQYVKDHDWSQYSQQQVAITCTLDIIIPAWAYMLVASRLSGVAKEVKLGGEAVLEHMAIDRAITRMTEEYDLAGARVVVKGCGSLQERDYAYVQLTNALVPLVSSLMYGEPCSTVPVYKRKN